MVKVDPVNEKKLIDVMGNYYNQLPELQKRICLSFLLSTQHYNADFPTSDIKRLGYCLPLIAPQKMPGYFRTDHNRRKEIMTPWVNTYISPFLDKYIGSAKNREKYIKLSSSLALPVLKNFYGGNRDFLHLEDLSLRYQDKLKKPVVEISLTIEELVKDPEEILEEQLKRVNSIVTLQEIHKKQQDVLFIFVLKDPENDSLILWAAVWHSQKKEQLRLVHLNKKGQFGGKIWTHLNECGAVPDRLAFNSMLTSQLKVENYLSDLNFLGISSSNPPVTVNSEWSTTVEKLKDIQFLNDPGSELYKEAILHWSQQFFDYYELTGFATDLLNQQVVPWISEEGTIVEWAKAYQNLMEIVMFCIQSNPDNFHDVHFEETVLSELDPQCLYKDLHRSVGLYSYGMGSIFSIFRKVLEREDLAEKEISVACVSQNYFETLDLIESFANGRQIFSEKSGSLHEITQFSDLLIADIHPNNAFNECQFENGVAKWVSQALSENPKRKMTLLLDVTLNHLSDPEIQNLLQSLSTFLREDQLEIYLIQSLAKLIQLGADNFSGGSSIYLGSSKQKGVLPTLSIDRVDKSVYYSFLFKEFSDFTKLYLNQVRENTDYVYQKLKESFDDLAMCTWMNRGSSYPIEQSPWSAVSLKTNVDDKTVYVALSFDPLFKILALPDQKTEENYAKYFRKYLMEFAEMRSLPLTERYSFGFPLSNLSPVCQYLRLSIGIENKEYLDDYCQLIADFSLLLSCYVKDVGEQFDKEIFVSRLREVASIQNGEKNYTSSLLNLQEIAYWEEGEEKIKVGQAKLYFVEGELRVLTWDHESDQAHFSRDIGKEGPGGTPLYYFEPKDQVLLLYQLLFTPNNPISIVYEESNKGYLVSGMETESYLYYNFGESKVVDGYRIEIESELSITTPEKVTYSANQLYVQLEQYGVVPVCVAKLTEDERDFLANHCYRKEFSLTLREDQKSVLIQLGEDRPCIDYHSHFVNIYNKSRLEGVIEYLNQLDYSNLPFPKGADFFANRNAENKLERALHIFGSAMVFYLSEKKVDLLDTIQQKSAKIAIYRGLYEGMLVREKQQHLLQKEPVKKGIRKAYETIHPYIVMDPNKYPLWEILAKEMGILLPEN